jgi:hypothetical protein
MNHGTGPVYPFSPPFFGQLLVRVASSFPYGTRGVKLAVTGWLQMDVKLR